jgi:hypothetical protein
MRQIAVQVCASMVVVLFLASLGAMVCHHAKHGVRLTEYLWAVVPWVMVAAAALPAVWPIWRHRETATTAPAEKVFTANDRRFVIDREAR